MAAFQKLATELKLAIVEQVPDFSTLHSMTNVAKHEREVFCKNAYTLLESTLARQKPANEQLIGMTVAAHLSNGHMTCTYSDQHLLNWIVEPGFLVFDNTKPEDRAIARQIVDANPFGVLQRLTDLFREIEELTGWYVAHRSDIEYAGIGASLFHSDPVTTRTRIRTTLWHLRRFVAQSTNLKQGGAQKTRRPTARDPETVKEMSATDVTWAHLDHLCIHGRSKLADLLELLEFDHARLGRHGIQPRQGTLMATLFGTANKSPLRQFEHIREKLSSVVAAHSGLATYRNAQAACAAIRNMAAKRSIGRRHPQAADEKAYTNFLAKNTGEDYIELFRPLVGFHVGSKQTVRSLVERPERCKCKEAGFMCRRCYTPELQAYLENVLASQNTTPSWQASIPLRAHTT